MKCVACTEPASAASRACLLHQAKRLHHTLHLHQPGLPRDSRSTIRSTLLPLQERTYDRVNAALTWNQKDEARIQFSQYQGTPNRVMRKHQEASGPEMHQTDAIPKLPVWQDFKRNNIVASPLSPLAKNITSINDLRNYASTIYIPAQAKVEDLNPNQVYALDFDMAAYPNTEAILLVNVKMIKWLGQVVASKKSLPCHTDGKYKLCYDTWILLSIGIHTYDDSSSSHSFAPLLLSLSKDAESDEHCRMLGDALDYLCTRFWGCVCPMVMLISDHSAGIKGGILRRGMKFANCYSHITWKMNQGQLSNIRKGHPHYEDLKRQLNDLHFVHTDEMKTLVIHMIGKVWARWTRDGEDQMFKRQWALNSLWNEYFVGDWSNWTLADCSLVALCTPTNNCQERWHLKIVEELRGLMRGSMGAVLERSIPKLMRADGRNLPDELNFKVLNTPTPIVQAALRQMEEDTRKGGRYSIWSVNDVNGKGYYILRLGGAYEKLTNKLIQAYEAVRAGALPDHIARKERAGHYDGKEEELLHDVVDIYRSLHKVYFTSDVLEDRKKIMGDAKLNKLYYSCTCKGNHHKSVCSHSLIANHMEGAIDVKRFCVRIRCPSGKRRRGAVSGRHIQPVSGSEGESDDEEWNGDE